ncbi:MAG: FtsW/RodA/SpoVE family cell cycle protein, partial [Chloroflexi bacterium]|nr:FtsW/RodA/SpoVE family cell cycle protein [Chloroflexota bacterium]
MSVRTRRLDPLAGRPVLPDYPLFALMLIILSLGLFLVFDASYARASQESGMTHGDPTFFFKQQAHWAVIGLVALLAALKLPYWKLSRLGGHALGLSVFLLVLVLVPHIGHRSHGAVRWLHFGPLQVQPSEIAKICTVIFLAAYVSRRERSIRVLKSGLMGALIPVGLVALLIIKEPDLGTALVLSVTSLVML